MDTVNRICPECLSEIHIEEEQATDTEWVTRTICNCSCFQSRTLKLVVGLNEEKRLLLDMHNHIRNVFVASGNIVGDCHG